MDSSDESEDSQEAEHSPAVNSNEDLDSDGDVNESDNIGHEFLNSVNQASLDDFD